METILTIVSSVLIFLGLVGIFLPLVPAVLLSFAGLALYAFATGFSTLSVVTLLIFFLLALSTAVLDVVLPAMGAGRSKSSPLAVTGAFVGTILGVFALGPLGIIMGPLLGAVLGELLSGRAFPESLRAGAGVLGGIIVGSLVKLVLVLVMAGFFVAALI
ncbi:MAG: DUF456 family protein [Patescibacteria group bacterium]